jgi:hypothetical protein
MFIDMLNSYLLSETASKVLHLRARLFLARACGSCKVLS